MPGSKSCRFLLGLALAGGGALRPGWAEAERGPTAAAPALELRGIMVDQRGPVFALHDVNIGASSWVRLHESWGGWTITAYHPAADSIAVASAQSQATLVLRTRRIGSAAGADPSAGTGASLPSDQQQRLDELAAEVQRIQAARRAGTLAE